MLQVILISDKSWNIAAKANWNASAYRETSSLN